MIEIVTEIQPGIYDLSNELYHSGVGISRSGLMKLRQSPLHYWQHYLNPEREPTKETSGMIIGSVFHTLVLEPHLFPERYFVVPKIDKRTKEGKEIWANIEISRGNREIISTEDFAQAQSMADSIKAVRFESIEGTAHDLLLGAQYEKSLYWVDQETEILCKARPDILAANMVCDLKSCVDASFYAFRRAVYDYGYHIQCAMLADAIKAILNKEINDFIFIAVEKNPPYAVAIYQLSEEILEQGRSAYKAGLRTYKNCLEKNYWPSYEIRTIQWEKQ